jgi:hypothetical protein
MHRSRTVRHTISFSAGHGEEEQRPILIVSLRQPAGSMFSASPKASFSSGRPSARPVSRMAPNSH